MDIFFRPEAIWHFPEVCQLLARHFFGHDHEVLPDEHAELWFLDAAHSMTVEPIGCGVCKLRIDRAHCEDFELDHIFAGVKQVGQHLPAVSESLFR